MRLTHCLVICSILFATAYSRHSVAGDQYTCLKSVIYTNGPDDYIYYADYYDEECGVNADPEPYEDTYHAVPEDCAGPNYCLLGIPSRSEAHIFRGLDSPLSTNSQPNWSKDVTPRCEFFEKLILETEGKSYNAKVFELRLQNGSIVFVGFEVRDIPSTVHAEPIILGRGDVKRCAGQYAYSVSYHGRKLLFLTARQDTNKSIQANNHPQPNSK